MSIGYELVPVSAGGGAPVPDRAWRWELTGSEVTGSAHALPRAIEDGGTVAADGASEVLVWLLAHYEGWGALDTGQPFTIAICPAEERPGDTTGD